MIFSTSSGIKILQDGKIQTSMIRRYSSDLFDVSTYVDSSDSVITARRDIVVLAMRWQLLVLRAFSFASTRTFANTFRLTWKIFFLSSLKEGGWQSLSTCSNRTIYYLLQYM